MLLRTPYLDDCKQVIYITDFATNVTCMEQLKYLVLSRSSSSVSSKERG